ncbi:MAG TPA: two-component regulator propeller domain-containing protein [Sunxiuqinia sp.]|nr:two-component regulator propeller domain-containing protein [Sunxiuqinia sp.]
MKPKILVVILFLVVHVCSNVQAQTQLNFNHLSIEDGLSNNSVSCIFQDREGYLWFGTLNGLNRYDGQHFKTYHNVPGDSTSISNNKIRTITQDGLGYIWIQTYDNQIHRLDPKNETILNFPAAFKRGWSDNSIKFLFESSSGVIWMYQLDKGCIRFVSSADPNDYSIAYFNKSNALASNVLNFVNNDSHGHLWIGTNSGLTLFPNDQVSPDSLVGVKQFSGTSKYNVLCMHDLDDQIWFGTSNGELLRYQNGKFDVLYRSAKRSGNPITFIEPTKNQNVCIGSSDGLILYDHTTKAFKHFTTQNSQLNSNQIQSAYHDKHDDIWLVTNQRGVTRFQPDKQKFTHFPLNPDMRKSIVEGEKQVFQEDNEANLWVGIYGGGIYEFDRSSETFQPYLYNENNSGSLSSNLVLSIFEDRSSNLWVGTYKRGLNSLQLKKNMFNTLEQMPSAKNNYNKEVRSILQDHRGCIWIGNMNGDLAIYDRHLKKRNDLNRLISRVNQHIKVGIYSLLEDSQGDIWIGTKGQGIFRLKNVPEKLTAANCQKIMVQSIKHDPANPNSLSGNSVYDLHEDQNGQIWAAIYHGGLNVIQNPFGPHPDFLQYKLNENDKYSISDNRIRCILEDADHNMWIGTANGLNFLSNNYLISNNKKFIQITNNPGDPTSLSNNDVVYLFQDSNHTIWAGTYGGGLNELQTSNNENHFTWKHFNTKSGLTSNVVFSIVEDGSKNLWMGTDLGLCKFSPAQNHFEDYYANDGIGENIFSESACLYTPGKLLLFGHASGLVYFQQDSIYKSKQNVPIVLTDFLINGEKDQKKYISAKDIIGHPSNALNLKYNQNFLTFEFAALDYKAPANVQYEYKLDNYEQNWNKSGNLNKAYYKALQPGEYTFRLRATNSDGVWLPKELKLQLNIAPPIWKTNWAYLIYFLILIFILWLVRKIMLERIHLIHQVNFEKEMVDEKLKFYTSISHEFKTPLSLIIGPVEDMVNTKNLPDRLSNNLNIVKRNSHRLLELVEQLLDFRKIQKGYFPLKYSKSDLVGFLKDICSTFVPLSKRKQIEFSVNCNLTKYDAVMDFKSIEKIVFNLLSNAFKYTPEGGTISLNAWIDPNSQQVKIEVEDTGEGIKEVDLPQIFTRFSFVDHSKYENESSSGIGLSLTKELVELHHGEIKVESTYGEGSKFTVLLPTRNKHVNGNAIEEMAIRDHSYSEKFIHVLEEDVQLNSKKDSHSLLNKEKILIVEDNADLRNYLCESLSTQYDTTQAADGKEGLEIAKEQDIDLIVCDIMMPEMDGLELTGILKKEFSTSHIPIILLTARSLDEHKIEGIEHGADDYITKPFNMVYLQKRIQNILRQRKQLKERFSSDLQLEPENLSESTADQKFLSEVTELIEANMINPEFTVDSLVEHFKFGRTIFYKKMKGISGYSPKEYVSIVRMKKAGTLLCDHNLNVSQVAYDVGFNDASYFSKTFKKHFGISPTEYQKNKLNGGAVKASTPVTEE